MKSNVEKITLINDWLEVFNSYANNDSSPGDSLNNTIVVLDQYKILYEAISNIIETGESMCLLPRNEQNSRILHDNVNLNVFIIKWYEELKRIGSLNEVKIIDFIKTKNSEYLELIDKESDKYE